MITYASGAQSAKYNRLFDKATKALVKADELKPTYLEVAMSDSLYKTSDVTYFVKDADGNFVESINEFDPSVTYYENVSGISSLAEYFGSIRELAEIDKKYTILPLPPTLEEIGKLPEEDEDLFVIDANSRDIKVPSNFAKNGVSVQGDQIAEIVYFVVDRFYDATDLDTCNIYIEWQLSQKDENGNIIKGISAPYVTDVESLPGKILFGWALNSDITRFAGNVQFAARFYMFDELTNSLTYSLSTKTATVSIKPSLDFNIPQMLLDGQEVYDRDAEIVLERLVDSTATGDVTKAGAPTWFIDLAETVSFKSKVASDPDSGKMPLIVEAISPDGGKLSYVWRKYDIDTNEYIGLILCTDEYKETEDESAVAGKYYYKEIASADEVPAYDLLTEAEFNAIDWSKTPVVTGSIPVLERKSQAYIDSTGRYVAVATNRVGKSRESVNSVICHVYHPSAVDITKDVDLFKVLVADEEDPSKNFKAQLGITTAIADQGNITYQWYKIDPADVANAKDDEGNIVPVQTKEYDAIGNVINVTINEPWTAIASEAVAKDYVIVGSADSTDETGADGDGYYAVVATNSINNETSTEESSPCRVTHAASPVDITISTFDGTGQPVEDNDSKTMLNVDFAIAQAYGLKVDFDFAEDCGEELMRTDEDTITYQWYAYRKAASHDIADDQQAAARGEYEYAQPDKPIEGANSAVFKPVDNTTDQYYCMITNTYNGTKATRCSKFFNVVATTV